ncbi:hypothetical protein [Candidatus Magnetominusculus dajiuhuensis]|uniref:hypothetical protein n=1 Tax=Candidatus Magnetominusculus dajiuhuensis TaxID=3137712 RepID=UPI003B43A6EC
MRVLIVYDSYTKTNKLSGIVASDNVYLFALQSKKQITESYVSMLRDSQCGVEIINTSKTVNDSAGGIRQSYIRFVAELPYKIQHKNNNLKEIFSIDKYASLWWFSLIAEKSTYKSDILTRLAQLDAITETIKLYNIEKIILISSCNKLTTAITEYAIGKSILINHTLPHKRLNSIATKIIIIVRQLISLLHYFIYSFCNATTIRKEFANIQRTHSDDNSLMLITYYPNLDISAAKEGRFTDKNYMRLQSRLAEEGNSVTMIAIYVENNAITRREAIRYAKTFITHGYRIYFLDEFTTPRIQLGSLVAVLFSAIKFILLEKKIKEAHVIKDYNIYALLKDDWHSSFMGATCYKGLVYYKTFKNLLSKFKVRKYLYLLEQQAWEKAFISAKNALNLQPAVLGSQSGTVSPMLFSFFNDPSEIHDTGGYPIPEPDIVICNGQNSYNSMMESGWPREQLYIAEAVRYAYLEKYLGYEFNKTEKIVLLACSISIHESSSMLNVLYEALNGNPGIEVWIKPHPFLHIEELFKYSEIEMKTCTFKIKNNPVGELLQRARIVVVGESSVCIEALAFGCEVFIVNSPEWISMSPLIKVGGSMIKTVSSADELQQNVQRIFIENYDAAERKTEIKRIINEFFYFSDSVDSVQRFYDLVSK